MKIVRDNPAVLAATGTALALVVLAGVGPALTATLARLGYLTLPAALGLPAGLPGLRFWPLGHTSAAVTITESLAAVAFIAVIATWTAASAHRHPQGSPARIAGAALAASVIGGIATGAIRLVGATLIGGAGIGTYLGYAAATVVVSALIGLTAGIPVAAATGVTARIFRRPTASDET